MTNAYYEFKRGETVCVSLDMPVGNPADVTEIYSAMRKLRHGRKVLDGQEPQPIELEVTAYPAQGDEPAGWHCVLPAPDSDELEIGNYVFDVRVGIGSSILISDSALITIIEPATF